MIRNQMRILRGATVHVKLSFQKLSKNKYYSEISFWFLHHVANKMTQ